MACKINIREAQAQDQDQPAILNLIKSAWRSEPGFAERYYDKYFSWDPMTHEDLVIVAEIGGSIVGVIGYCEGYFSNEYSYHLNWFVVEEKYRGWSAQPEANNPMALRSSGV